MILETQQNHTTLQKEDPLLLNSHNPTALANTIYKFYSSTLSAFLTSYNEKHKILHFSQQGFRPQRNTMRQIQIIIVTLDDVKLPNNDIYLAYIDFRNTFGFIYHVRLLALMEDLGYPSDAIELISNIFTNSTTSFHDNHFDATSPIHISKGMIQDNTLNPYRFIIFLDPKLWWLEKDNIGYHFNTSTITCNTITYADDLAAITDNLANT